MATKAVRKFIDIGANLTDPMFAGIYNSSKKHENDFVHVLNRAKKNGLDKIIITGGTLKESQEALDLANRDSILYSTVGCHPTRCNEFVNHKTGPEDYITQLKNLIINNKSKVVAIGELGLDYDRLHFCTKDVQKTYFEMQLKLSQDTKLPLFLHNRNSIDDFIEILERNTDKFPAGGVVHSFDGSEQDLKRILNIGLYIGLNGCSLKTEQNLKVVELIPVDKIMIETDCPWCEIKRTHASFQHVKTQFQKSKNAQDLELPVKNRNEPMTITQVLEVVAAVKQIDIDQLADQIYKNTNKLFFQQ